MGQQQQPPTPPPAPNLAQAYKQGTNLYLNNLPRYLGAEQMYRNTQDPQRIAEQQGLQAQFGPTQYSQQLQALQQLDPQWFANNQQLGQDVSNNMRSGSQWYNQLGNQVYGDLGLGTGISDSQRQQIVQGERGAQAARGNSLGSAAGTAEAFALGDRGNQMYQQRLANANAFSAMTPGYINAGLQYNQSATPSQMIQGISPVTADRSMAYVNPNAGFQGEQGALQNYQNQLAAMGLQQPQQNSPWGSILGTIGGAVGTYYGGAAGGQAGYQTSSAIGNWI